MNNDGRLKGIAEVSTVRRAADGTVLERSYEKGPVTYRLGSDGQPTDIRKED